MNKVYKHIWSKTQGRLVVVSECARGARGRKTGRRKLAASLMASTLFSGVAWAGDLPSGGQIVSGTGTIATSGNTLTVNQSTDRMIANWQGFSIGENNTVTFNQPGASSVALNRVVGQDPSQILGSLNANGQVFLLNPNGIAIGSTGSVQTGGFVASTLGMADEDFLAGKYQFTGIGGTITNQGDINGTVVALIAPTVTNDGTITGDASSESTTGVALAAGTDVLLDFDGDGLLSVEVKANTLAGLVENNGLIQADGGVAILTAKGASDALKGVVNNTGTVQARTLAKKNGRILLLGDMDNGEVNVAGTLDASAPDGGDGGFIETSAAKVHVADSASITTQAADGETGTWLIDPNDYTIAASGGDITGATLAAQLDSSNVIIESVDGATDGNGDIFVNDTVSWSANTLTLSAYRNIEINSEMTATGTAGLALEYGQGAVAAGNSATYTINAPVNLAATGSFSTLLGSDGTAINYTILTSLGAAGSITGTDLQGINGDLTGNYVLGADIDASATSGWNSGEGFAPIGADFSNKFTGTFDGLGHTITDLTINRGITDYVGLFGYASGATIRNIGLEGGSVTGRARVGALVGVNDSSTVEQSYASGSVAGANYVGGLVGYNYDNSSILNAYASGSVSGDSQIGGLVGTNYSSTINGSYASGSVTGTSYVGGLVGHIRNTSTVSQSYATGSVTGTGYVGGLVGRSYGSSISNAYATGEVSGSSDVGGLVGSNNWSTVEKSYWNTETSGQASGIGSDDFSQSATGLTTAEMQNPFSFIDAGWDFENVWGKSSAAENGGYMVLRTQDATLYEYLVRLGDIAKTYGDANPATSGIALDGIGEENLSLAWGSAITTTTGVGSYSYDGSNVLDLSVSVGVIGDYYVDYGALDIAKAALSVTANDASKTYGDTLSFAGTEFTTSGLKNSETVGTVTLTSTGAAGTANVATYDISAASATGGTFDIGNYDVTYNTGTLTVGKAALTVTASDASKTYDGLAFTGGNGVTYSGFVNSEDSSVLGGTLAYGGTAQDAVDAGSYTLAASGLSADNYDITYTDGTLTVGKAALTLTASDQSKTYGGAFSFTGTEFTTSGLQNGETVGTVTLTSDATSTTANAGSYGITASGATGGTFDIGNYAVTYNTGTFTVGKAALTVTANDASKTYGDTLSFAGTEFTTSGLKNSETVGTVTLTSTGAAATANVATYSISATNATGGTFDIGNYDVTYNTGTLTVGKAALSVTASDQSKTYGDAFSFAGTEFASIGLQNGETIGTVTLASDATSKTANVGSHGISAAGATGGTFDIGNYDVTYNTGTFTVNKAALTVTAANQSKTYGDAFTFAGTEFTASGLQNSETIGTVTLASDATSKTANVGSYGITAASATGGTFDIGNYDVTYNTGTFTVNKAALTVTANDQSKTYGDAFAFTGTEFTASGLKNSETVGTVTLASSGAAGTANVAAYDISAASATGGTFDIGNYEVTYNTGTLTVGKAALSVTANDAGKTYDGLAFTGGNGVTYSGFVNSEDSSVLGGTLAYGGTAQDAVDAGSYTLAASGLSADNYAITYIDGTLTVGKAALSVTANDASKTYDGLAFTGGNGVTYSGFVNSETDSVLGGTLGYGGTAQDAVNAGSYALTASGLTSGNYAISYTAGTLTVDKAALTVAANDASKTYDGLAFTGGNGVAYSGFVNSETDSVLGGTLAYGGDAQDAVNAGSYALTASGLTSGNYDVTYVDGTLTVNKAVISAITGLTANDKVYDGTTAAMLDTTGAGFTDMISGDSLTVATATGAFTDMNAGTGKTVNITGLSLGGGDAANYVLADTTAEASATIFVPLATSYLLPEQINRVRLSGFDGGTDTLLDPGPELIEILATSDDQSDG